MIYIILAIVALVVAWNLIPSLRDRLRGWSTIAEGALGTGMAYLGVFGEAIEEANAAGYIPDNWQMWVPAILFAWVVLKRFQTSTAVGGKD
jgi:hypothetical protein